MPMAWAEAGNHILLLEGSPYPNHFMRGDARWGPSLHGQLRRVHPRLHVGAMPPAFPRMLKGGLMGNALRALHRPLDRRRIRRYLRVLGWEPEIVVLMQEPVRYDLLELFPDALRVYYCNDLYGYGHGTANEFREEAECCRRVDVVFTTSDILRRRLLPHNAKTFHIPHAVDLAWWESNRNRHPAEMERIRRPRALFTGALTARIDFALLEEVAGACPHWQFVLIGPYNLAEKEARRLEALGNCHLFGAKPHEEIPGYLALADVLLFPYAGKATAQHCGLPLKFYEYAISGQPILSTDFAQLELPNPDLVHVARSPQQWVDFLTHFERHREQQAVLTRQRRELAERNTYQARIEQQRGILSHLDRASR